MSDSVNFDRAVEYYDQTRGFPPGVERHIPHLFTAAGNLNPTSRVLEIGVGTGRIAVPLAPHVGHYIGADISTGMMGKLREKLTTEHIDLLQADATRLPLKPGTFDAVIAVHVFHLIPAWRDALKEITRVLKPGAPLLHGWNGRNRANPISTKWDEITGRGHEAPGAVPFPEQETFLLDNGWSAPDAEHVYKFQIEQSPNGFIKMIEGRKWSRCWQMSDEAIEHGLSALRSFIAEQFPDPDAPIIQESNFHVRAYLPPQ